MGLMTSTLATDVSGSTAAERWFMWLKVDSQAVK